MAATGVVAGALVAAVVVTATAAPQPPAAAADSSTSQTLQALGIQTVPKATGKPRGPNPYLAIVADPSEVDYAGWRGYLSRRASLVGARSGSDANDPRNTAVPVSETEPADVIGENDTPAGATPVTGVGTDRREETAALLTGTLAPNDGVAEFRSFDEDDSAIPLAVDSGVKAEIETLTTTAVIGDGPYGSAGSGTGDFDFYRVTLDDGDTVTADTILRDTPEEEAFDTVLTLFDAEGGLIDIADDTADTLQSALQVTVPVGGDYFVMVSGFGPSIIPEDPFDPTTGGGAGAEGTYDLRVSVRPSDVDFFSLELEAGDVVGTSAYDAATQVSILDPQEVERITSQQDVSFIYPTESPLPGGGTAVSAYVARESGTHYIAASGGRGAYEVDVEVYRVGAERERNGAVQTIFLDFDGARLNTNIFGGPGVRRLSAIDRFIERWGLSLDDKDALIDETIAVVRENLDHDLAEQGLNPRFDVRIRNSRDHADSFGRNNVSRVIVGGSIRESGIPTIGIAQDIDPGNFDQESTALVLLDILSDPPSDFEPVPGVDPPPGEESPPGEGSPPGEESPPTEPAPPIDYPTINAYLTDETDDRVAAVAQVLGNVIAHEVGHTIGNFHTDELNETPNLQDQGGNFANLFGTGPDLVLGTEDDVDVDFGEDHFAPNEGFTGLEDTLNVASFGFTIGLGRR